jgi:uncharacterized protein YdeI (YjbR/CyaY-like superfamily)
MSDTKNSSKSDQPIISFNSPQEWNEWLEQNHSNSNGVWLRIFKKDTGIPTTTHAQALQEALCFGWIDGQAKKYDEVSYLQKFTPRRTKSIWSKRNVEYVAQLEKEGRMKPSGREQIEAAKADGRWDSAYDSPVNMNMPEDFLTELAKNERALAFFRTLNKTNTYAIGWRLQTAKKPETREKRMKMILEMLAREEKFH